VDRPQWTTLLSGPLSQVDRPKWTTLLSGPLSEGTRPDGSSSPKPLRRSAWGQDFGPRMVYCVARVHGFGIAFFLFVCPFVTTRWTTRFHLLSVETRKLEMFQGLLPGSQGQNLALPVLHVPYLLHSRTRGTEGTLFWGKNSVRCFGGRPCLFWGKNLTKEMF